MTSTIVAWRLRRRRALAWLLGISVLATACAAPVGTIRVDPRLVSQELNGSVLTTGTLSRFSRNVLFLHDIVTLFEKNPEAAIAHLRRNVISGDVESGADEIFALAELSYQHADRLRAADAMDSQGVGERGWRLAAALYAWTFLFPDDRENQPERFDPRVRIASDLYNRGLTEGFGTEYYAGVVALNAGTYRVPFGVLEVQFDRQQLRWNGRELTNFIPVAELEVQGLQARFRRPGIGAALAASIVPVDTDATFRDLIGPRVKVSSTALLRLEDPRQVATDRVRAVLELYTASESTTVKIGDRTVPLELEPTAALAWTLQEAPPWQYELTGFLGDVIGKKDSPRQLVAATPYRPGRIPVVFVHGTASSLGRWAEMYNRLDNEPVINERYQFWFFSYDSGQPIVYSSLLLREALTEAVNRLDPEGKDDALRQMVVIGHSQGGLLTKMTVVTTGSKLFDAASKKPLDELVMSDATRELIRRALFVEPLPFVKRVVFICTPHRGSYLAARSIVANLVRRIVSSPARLAAASADMFQNREALPAGERLPTAIDNMSPRNRFVRTLSAISVAPGVHAHSIIAVKGDGPFTQGDDGVVKYESAHIDGVDSEMVVRWDHSVQGHARAIEEVRRILLVHIGAR